MAPAPAAARKVRRLKKTCSGVARFSGISQPRRRMTYMGGSSDSVGISNAVAKTVRIGAGARKSQIRDGRAKGYATRRLQRNSWVRQLGVRQFGASAFRAQTRDQAGEPSGGPRNGRGGADQAAAHQG